MIDRTLIATGAVILALIVLVVVLAVQEQRRWDEFASDHNCRVVGRERGSTKIGYGMATNGTMGTVVTSTPSKTGWLCDDGVTYWR